MPLWPGCGTTHIERLALQSAANSIAITDCQGNIMWEEVRGANMRVLKSGKHASEFYKDLWKTILSGRVWRGEVMNRRKDGSCFFQDQTITPVCDQGGLITHFIAIQQDISARKEMELMLREREQRLTQVERQRAVAAERARIACDMHDELGASLTRIKVLSERMERDADSSELARAHARKIAQTSRELAEQMDEVVWAVDPRNDDLENLGSYLVSYTEEFLRAANLGCRLELPEVVPEVPLSADIRHSLLLAVKEALNNVVKHARATEVQLHLAVRDSRLNIEVSDNGRGFLPQAALPRGNGLGILRRRLAEAGGECVIQSHPGQGTQVKMELGL